MMRPGKCRTCNVRDLVFKPDGHARIKRYYCARCLVNLTMLLCKIPDITITSAENAIRKAVQER